MYVSTLSQPVCLFACHEPVLSLLFGPILSILDHQDLQPTGILSMTYLILRALFLSPYGSG